MRRALTPFLPLLLGAYAVALSLTACAVGPDFERPAAPAANALGPAPVETASAPGLAGEAQRFSAETEIPAQWWELFHSTALNKLIEEALAHNADLAAAQAALRVARETGKANEGQFFPQLTGSFQASREKDPTNTVQPTAANGSPQLNLFTPQVSVGYVPDVWGGIRRGQESLDAQTEAQAFQLEATHLTLTANLVVAAITEASLRGQLTATRRVIEIERETLDISKKQLALGQIGGADLLAQEAALAQAEQTLPPLEKQLAQQRHQLTALLGCLPGEEPGDRFELADLQLPQELPLALPSRLVAQRPDIRMAQANMQSASAQVGVAIANRLPDIALSGTIGSEASQIQQLFMPGNGLWSIQGTLTQPLFDGFALMHKERAARAALDQAADQYRGTVITAFQNVADCLTALKIDADGLRAATTAASAADRSLAIVRKQLEVGQIGYLSLLNAEQTALQAHIALVQAQAARLADTAALIEALGGGWWSRGQNSTSE